MAVTTISVDELLLHSESYPVIDVRSPSEYSHAHVPKAISLPLFTDAERVQVGTAYKQRSREDAIKIGLDYFGPKMRQMVEDVEAICASQDGEKSVIVHCWRGGMRSGAVAWLLDLYGFKVYLLQGGYKSFRRWCLNVLPQVTSVRVIGGNTGSGKTHLLHYLRSIGEEVLDLEGLANHKGSAFGNIGMPKQPSQEMFENLVAIDVHKKIKSHGPIWIEDESQRIGNVKIPGDLFSIMSESPVFFLEVPFENRLDFIVSEYGTLEVEKLADAIFRIEKRLGGLETRNAVNLLMEGNVKASFGILLKYYDKHYQKGLQKKKKAGKQIAHIPCTSVNVMDNAKTLLTISQQTSPITKT